MIPQFDEALGFDDIGLLPNFSGICSRKALKTETRVTRNWNRAYPIIASPMDTVSGIETCVALNNIRALGILHRFMPDNERIMSATEIVDRSDMCAIAISVKDDISLLKEFYNKDVEIFVLDVAHGTTKRVFEFIANFKKLLPAADLITGNTLTKESVTRSANLSADGFRQGIGIGSRCLTSKMTGICCPPITALYYGWKGIRNWELNNNDVNNPQKRPSLLLDGGIRDPGDLSKAICAGADAVISGSIFAGCKETPGEIVEVDGKPFKKYRGMASREVVEENELWDGDNKNLFVEGESILVPARDESVVDVVYRFANGLRSTMSYLGFNTIEEMRGSLWTGKTKAVRIR